MLYREIMAVCSEIHTKNINILCGRIVEFVNVKSDGTYSNHWILQFTANGLRQTMYCLCLCLSPLLGFVCVTVRKISHLATERRQLCWSFHILKTSFLSITATRKEKDSHSSVRKFWSQFSTWKSYKLAVYRDGELVSSKVLFSVRRVLAGRLIIFRSSVLLFCQDLLLAQKADLADVTYRWHDQLEIRTFWFAGIEWMIRLHILHAHVRACYTFCRCITANGILLTNRHTQRMLTVPERLSIFPVPVKLPCQSCLQAVKFLPFTFIEKGDSETIKYKTVPRRATRLNSQVLRLSFRNSSWIYTSTLSVGTDSHRTRSSVPGHRTEYCSPQNQTSFWGCKQTWSRALILLAEVWRDIGLSQTCTYTGPVRIGNRTHDPSVRAT